MVTGQTDHFLRPLFLTLMLKGQTEFPNRAF